MKRFTEDQERDIAVSVTMREEDIDFSDMPEMTDFTGGVRGMFYRPAKKPVTMWLNEDVVAWLKGFGPG